MKLTTPRSYTLMTGLILFLIGFLGFAFRQLFDLSDKYLLLSLILGFWGLVVAGNSRGNKGI
jgi:hypothetical protein